MEDIVFNAMTNFQFFCNEIFKQKNIDKLMPKGMLRSEWNVKKSTILQEEVTLVTHYLEQQAAIRLEGFPAASKPDIEIRYRDTIAKAISGYKEKIYAYYLL